MRGRSLAGVAAIFAVAGCSAILGIGELTPTDDGGSDGATADDRTVGEGAAPDANAVDASVDQTTPDSAVQDSTAQDSTSALLPPDGGADAGLDGSSLDAAGDRASSDGSSSPDVAACVSVACTPANVCDKGSACEGGTAACEDLDAAEPLKNGASCGTDLVCASGSCLSAEWAEWRMPNFAQGATHVYNTKSYTDNGDGTATDNVTGLMWQQALDGAETTDAGPGATTFTFADAVQYCSALTLAGHAYWRMPTVIELVSLVDYSLALPAIDSPPFPGTPSSFFWASTPVPTSTSLAGVVGFDNGGVGGLDMSTGQYVRCVR